MGRLFWKFFFIFWLAQVVTSFGVGAFIWWEHPNHNLGARRFDGGPPPPPPLGFDDSEHRPPGPPPPGGPPPQHLPMPLMPIIAGSVVSLLFAALLAWYFATPIRSLRTAFESVAGGQLETRVSASMGRRSDELADLGSDFDRMAGRLQMLRDAQHRLMHDVSHELRSPLARLQAAADLMRQQPERGAEFAERIQRDTKRMDQLIGELLTLARLDSGISGHLDDSIDLHEIMVNIAEDARFEAESRHCQVDVDIAEHVMIHGDSELIHRAIENVVRNALRYSPEGGRVNISAKVIGNGISIKVADKGIGVPEGDLDAIFEPFFRSANTDAFAGYGLGLAITCRIVEAHGGNVVAENRDGGGLVVSIHLPKMQLTVGSPQDRFAAG